MTVNPDDLIRTEDILASTSEDGEIRVNLGDQRDGKGVSAESPVWFMDGFVSRPNDPSDAGAAQALALITGNEKLVIGSRDDRFADKIGMFDPGDRGIITDADARILVKKVRNAVTLYTVNEPADDNMTVDLDGKAGKLTIACGTARLIMTDGRIEISTNDTTMVLDKDGLSVFGQHAALNTGSGNLGIGAATPLTMPPAPITAIMLGPTGVAAVPSPSWTVSPI